MKNKDSYYAPCANELPKYLKKVINLDLREWRKIESRNSSY